MTLFLCQDHDTVWTKSRPEGFKWWVTEKWMEEPRVQSPDLHTTTFMIIKTPPSTGNQIKLNALSLCMTSVLHLPCPAIRILCWTIFFYSVIGKVFLWGHFSSEPALTSDSEFNASLQSRESEGDQRPFPVAQNLVFSSPTPVCVLTAGPAGCSWAARPRPAFSITKLIWIHLHDLQGSVH